MQTSILIAKLMGPILVVAGLTGLLNAKAMTEMAREFIASRPLLFIGGLLALLMGLAIVNTHNLWVADWPVIITLFGWLAILGGIIRIAIPDTARSIGEKMLKSEIALRVSGALQVILGLYLMVVGYL